MTVNCEPKHILASRAGTCFLLAARVPIGPWKCAERRPKENAAMFARTSS